MVDGVAVRWIVTLQTAIGAVLLAAVVGKALTRTSLRPFLEALALPPRLTDLGARGVPVLEGACGLLLLAGITPWSAAPAVLLSAVFVATLIVAWRAGIAETCRCFGALDAQPPSVVTILRAGTLACASLALLMLGMRSPPGAGRLIVDADTAIAFLLGAMAAGVYLAGFALLAQVWSFERGRRTWIRQLRALRDMPRPTGR